MALRRSTALNRVAFVGNSVPRRCGIATFTTTLCEALAKACRQVEVLVVPVTDTAEGYDYPPRVWFEMAEREVSSYRRAADFLTIKEVDVVSLQHEFGIFGGPAGSHVLALLRDLRMPIVTTLHTVLNHPDPNQQSVMDELAELSSQLVVMTDRGAKFLREIYGVPEWKISIIPHGILDVSFIDPNFHKDKFGVEGKNVLLTFGLVGPNKGIEYVIQAMPEVLRHHPDTVYVVLGATHPSLLRQQGETYREHLHQLAQKLGVERNVIFHNRFVSEKELVEFLGMADIYITPYPNREQICSGTLAYAAGSGKAVVSTPYWHAEELLTEGRGQLVEPGRPDAISSAVIDLLDHPTKRHAMRKAAYLYGREMVWSKIAERYMETFERAIDQRRHHPAMAGAAKGFRRPRHDLPSLDLSHLLRLTDHTGMLQHATYSVPNYAEGYATDDNARALILIGLLEETFEQVGEEISALAWRYMSFLQFAFNPQTERFRNFLSFDRFWLEEAGSEDCHGRTLWALGSVVSLSPDRGLRQWAATLLEKALPAALQFTSPRAWAFTLLGVDAYLRRFGGDRIAADVQESLARRLLEMYRSNATPQWPWFEDVLSYCNARIPHALLVSGRTMSDEEMVTAALESLAWLAQIQRPDHGHFVPIGSNGFYPKEGPRARFDQQPVEGHCMVSACLEALRCSGEARWQKEAGIAFEWFLGRNDLGRPLYDPTTGGCFDGLHPDGANRNQGAESTLAYLLARTETESLHRAADHEAQEVTINVSPELSPGGVGKAPRR